MLLPISWGFFKNKFFFKKEKDRILARIRRWQDQSKPLLNFPMDATTPAPDAAAAAAPAPSPYPVIDLSVETVEVYYEDAYNGFVRCPFPVREGSDPRDGGCFLYSRTGMQGQLLFDWDTMQQMNLFTGFRRAVRLQNEDGEVLRPAPKYG